MYQVTVYNQETNTRSRTTFNSYEDQTIFINGVIEALELVFGFESEVLTVNNTITIENIMIKFTLEH